jgi:hypothetical protein
MGRVGLQILRTSPLQLYAYWFAGDSSQGVRVVVAELDAPAQEDNRIILRRRRGDPYPEICAQRTLGAEEFLL